MTRVLNDVWTFPNTLLPVLGPSICGMVYFVVAHRGGRMPDTRSVQMFLGFDVSWHPCTIVPVCCIVCAVGLVYCSTHHCLILMRMTIIGVRNNNTNTSYPSLRSLINEV